VPFWSRPVDASLDGYRSDWTFDFVTVGVAIAFAVVVVVLLWSVVFWRARPGRKARYDHGMARKNLVLTALVTGTVFIGIDGTALYHSYLDLYRGFWKFPTAQDQPLQIEVWAQQWAWHFRYPGPDGKLNTDDDVVTLNDLRIPVGRPVLVRMKAKDVVHSFYLPNFRIKQDVIPGQITQMWFQAQRLGVFEIACAQHCGANHYKMRGVLTVQSADDYATWLREESARAAQRFDREDPDAHWGWDWES